jgi:rfaE bifunctional protein kinase chain/domain
MDLIDRLQRHKIMIIGDMVADVYMEGTISRISREAPVLVLEHKHEKVVAGGAANAVHNVAALGGKAFAVGVLGEDAAGREMIRILGSHGVETGGLVLDHTRPTITKTRIMAGGQATVRQQVVRIDKESKAALLPKVEELLKGYIQQILAGVDAVILSDYGSGTITPAIMQEVIRLCRDLGKPCIVDSRYNILAYQGVTVIKQNESEAAKAVGYEITDEASLIRAGKFLLESLGAEAVLISRGPEGMSLFENTGAVIHIPVTNKSEVYDVTGAGDTVVATMILALAAGAGFAEAARLSNFAAGVVVRKLGTATASPAELKQAIDKHLFIDADGAGV